MKLIYLLIMILASIPLSAVPESKISLVTDIPEDYGIEFPEAVHIDHLYFGVEENPTERDFIRLPIIEVGNTSGGDTGYYRLNLYYFGNMSGAYDVKLSAESVGGFRLAGSTAESIPLDVRFEIPEVLQDSFDVEINPDGSAQIAISPEGPVRGREVVNMVFSWDAGGNAVPGEYVADVFVRMETR